ncbi:hypothetical protein [Paenibacillus sp. S150]|uniref:hypothetical protein n=1 Tax=Paenibacillus sp. S150 TaxID=2749826 RepID=UPI001C566DB8|nr:hypothetical protein [Paenibacillus sp. S150]MBW4081899.1 hypothetical protein [Paenibacillus sp. S150]
MDKNTEEARELFRCLGSLLNAAATQPLVIDPGHEPAAAGPERQTRAERQGREAHR